MQNKIDDYKIVIARSGATWQSLILEFRTMFNEKYYYVYIITNFENSVLYTGVTNNIQKRIDEHKTGAYKGFSSKYKLTKLVYYETFNDINDAIAREKQIKAGSRKRKEELINKLNSERNDLFESLF